MMIWIVMLSVIIAYFCRSKNHKTNEKATNEMVFETITPDSLHFQKLQKKIVIGDFDGDNKQDTVVQHIFSRKYNTELDSIPIFPENDYFESVADWFYDQEADLYLIFKNDTLHFGTAYGFYCLINLGDLNGDKKDEIALSVDYFDYSAINSCKIYTICNGNWALLKHFPIHESTFDFTSDTVPVFKEE